MPPDGYGNITKAVYRTQGAQKDFFPPATFDL